MIYNVYVTDKGRESAWKKGGLKGQMRTKINRGLQKPKRQGGVDGGRGREISRARPDQMDEVFLGVYVCWKMEG